MEILLTDIQFHTTKIRNRPSFWRLFQKAARSKKPEREYIMDFEFQSDGTIKFSLEIPEELQQKIKESGEELKILVPKGGLPILPGKDTIQFLNSKRYKELKKK